VHEPSSVLPGTYTMYKRVLTFLNKHNMISEAQNGIREKKKYSTQTFIEDFQKTLDNKLLVMDIYLYLTKAFDGPCHSSGG
jgi:thermostable 8-oxoguanine DNA glycosylase